MFSLQQASMSQTTCTETTTGTLTRHGYGFENGHVTHLDLAAVHPRVVAGGNHVGTPHGTLPHNFGFLTGSLSAAALNADSCAVPMMDLRSQAAPLIHSSSLGWGANGRGSGIRYQHQEECPHFNSGFKEAPT